MKGGGGSGGAGSKRRWRGLAIAVLGLVIILSMLVPLGFLLGFQNGILPVSTGYLPDQHNSVPENNLRSVDNLEIGKPEIQLITKKDQASHIDDVIKKLEPTLPKDLKLPNEDKKPIISKGTSHEKQEKGSSQFPGSSSNATTVPQTTKPVKSNKEAADDSGKSCELRFGAYCLWRQQHRQEVRDSLVRKMKDRLFEARAYFPSIAKIPSKDNLTREMKQNIQDFERVLSESSTDSELPSQIGKKMEKMETVIAKAKSCPVECSNVDKKFRQLLDLTEDEANFHMKQSAFLYQVATQTTPKSLHCLSMRLTVDYFRSPPQPKRRTERYSDPSLLHLVIFSNNVLASSVAINSTVSHAEESRNMVFHVLTDEENYFAMELWFYRNTYKEATVQVLNVEKFDQQFPLLLPEEFRASIPSTDGQPTLTMKTEYLSIFSESHYLLPKIFPELKKVVVLDQDVVVQKDLTELWSLDMGGKVNGATQTCSLRLDRMSSFLGGNNLDKNSCAWMSGLNLVDLSRWRDLMLTETYRRFLQQDTKVESIEFAVLRASLLTFHDHIYALDSSWMVSGLGHNYEHSTSDLRKAAVLHYNGNMKPWLELGIPKYKPYWKKHLNWADQILSDCNICP